MLAEQNSTVKVEESVIYVRPMSLTARNFQPFKKKKKKASQLLIMNFNHIDQRCNLSGRSELGQVSLPALHLSCATNRGIQDSHSYNSAFAFDLGYFMDFGWTASGFQMPNPYLESSNSTVSSSAMFSSIDDQGLFELAYEQSWKGTSTASNGWPSICCRNKGIVSNVDISGTWENPQAVSTAPLSTSFIHDQYYEGDEEEEQEAPKPFGFVTAEEHPQANYSQRESNTAEESPSSVGGFSKSSQTSVSCYGRPKAALKNQLVSLSRTHIYKPPPAFHQTYQILYPSSTAS